MPYLPLSASNKRKRFYSPAIEIEFNFNNSGAFSGLLTNSKPKLGLQQRFKGFYVEDDFMLKLAFFSEEFYPYLDSTASLTSFSGEIFVYDNGKSECLVLRWLTVSEHNTNNNVDVLFDERWKNESTEIDMIRSKISLEQF
jgi:hypothetical protein